MTDQAFDARRLKIEDVERELRRRLQKFCAPEVVLDRGPRGGSNIIDRIDAIDPATTSEEEQTDLREWTPIIARVRLFLASAKAHRNNIFALNDEEKIKTYDLSRGWPDDETDAQPEDREEDIQLREADIHPISAEPEASVTPQAEEVKPTEGDINLPEALVDELDTLAEELSESSIDDLIEPASGGAGIMVNNTGGVMAADRTEELRAKKIGETVIEHRRLVDASFTVDEAHTLQQLRSRSNAAVDGTGNPLTDDEQTTLDRLAVEETWAARMDAELQRRLAMLNEADAEYLQTYSPRGGWE